MSNEQENPLVSVVIPTYKRPDMLGRAINSVLNQTYDNIEIIVVDDNDEDSEYRIRTEKFMEEKYDDVDNLFYLKHKINKGGAAARNTGIKKAKGEYIAFLDDDDEYHLEKIELQTKKFLDSSDVNLALISCNLVELYRGESIKVRKPDKTWAVGGTPTWMVKKEALFSVGLFDESMESLQEVELSIRILKKYTKTYVDKILVKVYLTQNSIMRNNPKNYLGKERIIKKHYNEIPKEILSSFYLRIATSYTEMGERKKGLKNFLFSIKENKFNYRPYLGLIALLLGKGFYHKLEETYKKIKSKFI